MSWKQCVNMVLNIKIIKEIVSRKILYMKTYFFIICYFVRVFFIFLVYIFCIKLIRHVVVNYIEHINQFMFISE